MAARSVSLGVVGLGGWGRNVVRSFAAARNCRLSYICDAYPTVLAQQRILYPHAQPTTDYDDLLADRHLDAVALVTPAPTHFALAKAALEAGKHVYVEKPMTLTVEHAEELVDLSERKGLKLMVGHLLEYHPAVDAIKQQIDSGALGQIYYMYSQRLSLGVVRQQENACWSLAPHDISVILYLFGCEPDEVSARGECFLQPGIEDVVFVNLHFPDGRTAQIHVSWLDPHKERKMVVVGSKKMLVFDDMQPSEKLRIFDKCAIVENGPTNAMQAVSVRHGDIFIPRIAGPEPLNVETQHFINAILEDTVPRSDGRDGLRVVRVLEWIEHELHSVPDVIRFRSRDRQEALSRIAKLGEPAAENERVA
jgi:predicted dehydrogenase